MIKVTGVARLRVEYSVLLDMTEEEFETLSNSAVEEMLDECIDWNDACRSAETEDIDIDEVEPIEEATQ